MLQQNFCNFIGDDYLGSKLVINIIDESGNLTLNTSQFYLKDSKVCIGINLRVPVHTKPDEIIQVFEKTFLNQVCVQKIQPALYLSKEEPLIQSLCSIFNETCKTNFEPVAIGGATYARAFPNCISFGMNFPRDTDMCHQVDEFIEVDKLILASKIYAEAIYELAK